MSESAGIVASFMADIGVPEVIDEKNSDINLETTECGEETSEVDVMNDNIDEDEILEISEMGQNEHIICPVYDEDQEDESSVKFQEVNVKQVFNVVSVPSQFSMSSKTSNCGKSCQS